MPTTPTISPRRAVFALRPICSRCPSGFSLGKYFRAKVSLIITTGFASLPVARVKEAPAFQRNAHRLEIGAVGREERSRRFHPLGRRGVADNRKSPALIIPAKRQRRNQARLFDSRKRSQFCEELIEELSLLIGLAVARFRECLPKCRPRRWPQILAATARNWAKLRISSPAPTSRTNESANCETTKAERKR